MSEKNKRLSVPVSFEKIEEIDIEDNRFLRVKIWIMHIGQNYNGSFFERSVVENAIPTLEYIPIVGFIEDNESNEKDFSDHRYVLTKTKDGVEEKYIGSAYGVILSSEDNNAHFEKRNDDEGIEREYLVVEGLLWNMFEDGAEIMNNSKTKSQSMELDPDNYEGYEDENGIFHFTEFSFRASCILGSDYEAGMAGSTIEVVNFSLNKFSKAIQEEFKEGVLKEIQNKFTLFTQHKENQGGVKPMSDKTKFTLTAVEQLEEVRNIVTEQEITKDYWGDAIPRYTLVDIQGDTAIVMDRSNHYNLYGCPISMNGDAISIDFSTPKRMKTTYTDFDDNADNGIKPEFEFGNVVSEEMKKAEEKITAVNEKFEKVKSENEAMTTEFEKIKSEYETIKPKYEDFVKAEQERNKQEINKQKDELFTKFETSLGENEDFVKLREDRDEYSVEEIESKCAVLYCRKSSLSNYSKKKSESLSVGIINDDDEGGEFVHTKYGDIPRN